MICKERVSAQPPVRITISYLVKFKTHQADNERGGGSDGRNDFTCYLLRGMTIGDSNVVIHRTKVGRSGDKIDVMVSIIVLLELDRSEAVANK